MLGTIIVNGSWYIGGPAGSPGTATPPTITSPTSLPVGTINTAYANTQFTATGNTPITWSITSGTLPSGLTFNSSGLLFGTPTASATGNIQFTAANSVGSANVTLPLTVNSVATAPTVTTTTLPSASVGASYSFNLAATGTTPYTWAVQSGILPNGLGLSSTGVISGTPTTQGTTSGLVFRATNSVGFADSTTMSLAINAAGVGAPVITNYYMSAGLAGAPYSYTLGATGAPTITWTLVNGTLPPGLSLASNGVISGTPTSTSTSSGLIFRATNGSGTADTPSQDFAAAGTAVTYPSYPPLGVVGTSYTPIQFIASGTAPINWSVSSGALPSGMTFSSSGVLSGTPTSAVSGNLVSFQASNVFGSSSTRLKITASPSGSAPAVPSNTVTTALTATGTGTTYSVYNDTDMDNVPWGALGAGDVVNIYWKSTPYARKWGMGRNIANTGTASNPIIVNGVTDASGNRPKFNFNGATTAKGSNPSLLTGPYFGNTAYDLYNQADPYNNLEDYTGVLIRGFYQSSPAFIQIKNLELYGARGTFTSLSGITTSYITSPLGYPTSAIRVQNGNDILIENCVIKDCGWGMFTQTNGPNLVDTVNRFTMRKCFLSGNGVVGSGTEHNAYIQGTNPVIEGNYFGPLIDGALGSSYKSRASGEIFRYNWVETNARAIDFVEPEDQASGIIGIYDQSDYGIDHVYGNVIAVDEDQMKTQNEVYHPFHFGSDKNYYPEFNPLYASTGTSLIDKDTNWTGTAGSYAVFPSGSSISTTSTSGSFICPLFGSTVLAVGLRVVVYGTNTGGSGLSAGTYLVSATNGMSNPATFTLTTTDGAAITTNVGTGNNTGLKFSLALITSYNPTRGDGVWQAAISNTLTRAYYVNPSTTPASLDNQPDNQQSCFVLWKPSVYNGSTIRKIFVQYSATVPRDGYEAELTATQVILRRNGTSVGTYTHGLTGLTTTQTVILGVELSPGASSSVDVKVRCSTAFDSRSGIGYTAPVCITYNDTSPLTGGYSGLLINDGGTSTNVKCAAIQPSIGLHRYQFGSDGTTDLSDGGYRQAQGSDSTPSVTPAVYIGGTINGTKQNRRQLYFYNNSFICNTVQNEVLFELTEKTATVDAWNNLFWVSGRNASIGYPTGSFKINERGGNFNFRSNSNIFYATSDATIRTSYPNNGTASGWTPTANYNITGRTLPSDLNNPITTDADPLLTAVGAPTYNYLPTATYATTGGITSFPSGLPASFKSLNVQYQPGNRTNAMVTRSSLSIIGALTNFVGTAFTPAWLSSITGASSSTDAAIETGALYVSTTGNDTTGTGSVSSPYATLGKAISAMNAASVSGEGKTIYLRAGTYTVPAVNITCGNSANPVKIKRYPAEAVTISGSSTEYVAFSSYGSAIEIYGISFSGYLEHVVNLESSGTSYKLTNLTFNNCGSIIKASANCNNIDIQNIVYNYTGSSALPPIDCSIGYCDTISIQQCSINCAGSTQSNAVNGIDIGPSSNVTIKKCFVDGIKGHTASVVASRGNCTITGNYLKQTSAFGKSILKVYPGFNDTGSGNAYSCIIETNVMLRTSATASTDPLLLLENSLGSAIVRRNTIINESATPVTTVLDDCGGSTPLAFGTIASVAYGDGVAFTHTTPTVNSNGDYLMDVTCTTLTPHRLSVGDAFVVAKTIVRSTNASPAVQINGEQTVSTVISPTQFTFTVYTGSNSAAIGIASSGDTRYVLHRGLNFTYLVTPGVDYTSEGGLRITAKFPLDTRGFQILPVGTKIKVYGTSADSNTNIDGTWTVTTASPSTLTFLVPANYSSVSSSVAAGTGPQGVIVAKSGVSATVFRSVNDSTQDRRIIGNIILATDALNTGKLVVSNSKAGSTQVNNWRYNAMNVAAAAGTLVNFADLPNLGANAKNYTAATISSLNSENSAVGVTGNVSGVPDFNNLADDRLRLKSTDTVALNKYLDNVLVSTTDCDGLSSQVESFMDIGALERQ